MNLIWLDNIPHFPINIIGGKAKGLGNIRNAGGAVPDCFCISTLVTKSYFQANDIDSQISLLFQNNQDLSIDVLGGKCQKAQELIRQGRFPLDIEYEITENYKRLLGVMKNSSKVIVRSSSVSEDVEGSLAPGQYESIKNVDSVQFALSAIKEVWASYFSLSAVLYRKQKNISLTNIEMAVLVQQHLQPKLAGVIYTIDADRQDASVLILEIGVGDTSDVVTGASNIFRYYISKYDGYIFDASKGATNYIDKDLVAMIFSEACRVEKILDLPLDIEWIVTQDNELFLVQARSLVYSTTKTNKNILKINESIYRSQKIETYKVLQQNGLLNSSVHIIGHQAFLKFKNGDFFIPNDLQNEIRSLLEGYAKNGPVFLRSAYYSALNRSVMLPAFMATDNVDECFNFLLKFWTFIIQNKLDDYSSEICLLVHNFSMPFASCNTLFVNSINAPLILIEALYGLFDGLETSVHDIYEVNANNLSLISKNVPRKVLASYNVYQEMSDIPEELQVRSVLCDSAIREISRQTRLLVEALGPLRVEFFIMSDKGEYGINDQDIVVWQFDKTEIARERTLFYQISKTPIPGQKSILFGKVLRLSSPEQIEDLHQIIKKDHILLIDLGDKKLRNMILVNQLCGVLLRTGNSVVFKGSILSHIASAMRDYNIRLFPVNQQLSRFRSDEKMYVYESF